MVPYNPHLDPSLAQWSALSTSMQVAVALDQPGNIAFTNLDQISGRIMLRSAKPSDVSAIVVKLEGESRTRLMSPPGTDGQRPKPQVEYHKILYKVQTVFPPADVLSRSAAGAKYTIPQGQHEYPFSFKLPFNNSCATNNKSQPPMLGLDPVRPAERHVKKTLPPTLSGFPGEAEVRYYVKVTVNRQSFFKENPRAYTPFNFFPIEPPRPASTGSEVYARQRHAFVAVPGGGDMKGKMKELFSSKKSSSSTPNSPTSPTMNNAPSVSVDARLPEPAILTCNSDIPLRLILKKLNEHEDALHLDSLQISLIGLTKVRAHEVFRTETQSWIIMSKSNMNVPIGKPTDPINTETLLDDHLWRSIPLPNTVAPTFQTCNIERSYQLDIRIGLAYHAGSGKPQKVTLPLRLDTLVYSGIAPPPEILSRMSASRPPIPKRTNTNAMAEKLRQEGRSDSEFGANQIPPTPVESPGPSAWSARPGNVGPEEGYEDAPPSYEDAIASDLPPVATQSRPAYEVPPQREDPLLGDEKKGFS